MWGDPKIEGVLSAVPYLKKLGVTPENRIYKFDFNGARFIFLWTGKYDYRSPSQWDGDRPKYAEQMKRLQQWLDEAKAKHQEGLHHLPLPVLAQTGLYTALAFAKLIGVYARTGARSGTSRPLSVTTTS